MSIPRLFVKAPLASGAEVALDDAQARYLRTVLRLEPRADVRTFNGADGEWRTTLVVARRGMALQCVEQTREQSVPPDLTLLFAPLKRAATDLIAEKATELGVRTLQPALTRRTRSETVRTERLRLIAIEAAEQTERLDVPDVRDAIPLRALLARWDPARRLIFADEAGEGAPIVGAVSRERAQSLALLVGPEGGFEAEERALLRSLPFVTLVSLGPRILRAETAVIAALALIQAHWGDWQG